MSLKKLRKVRDHIDIFTEEDHNDHVDNWNTQLEIDCDLAENSDDPELIDLIEKLKSIVSKMRKVKTGDFYYANDHNLFVDAWNLQAQINDLLKEMIGTLIISQSVETLGEIWTESEIISDSVTVSSSVWTEEETASESVTTGEEVWIEQQS